MRFIAVVMTVLAFSTTLKASDWPSDYTIAEGSKSPDSHYAVLIPSYQETPRKTSDTPCYLVDLNTHRLLGKIAGINYEENKSQEGLYVSWSPDSRFCIVEHFGQFGFYSINVLRIQDNNFEQTEIGAHIQEALNKIIIAQSRPPNDEYECNASGGIRIDENHKIRFFTLGSTNSYNSYYAFFHGTYNVDAARWEISVAQPIDAKVYANLDSVSSPWEEPGVIYSSRDSIAKSANEKMDQIFAALRFYLPQKEFDKIKSSQSEWIKQREAVSSLAAQNAYFGKRIKELQDKIWWQKDETK